MSWDAILQKMLRSRVGRSVADALFRYRARHRLARLDEVSPARAQLRALRGLVHRCSRTTFGLDHDFHRICTEEDFRRLVPLRAPTELWSQYCLPAFPNLENAVWPGTISYLATCDSSMDGWNGPLTVTAELGRSHRDALLTALAFIQHARPHARLLSGSLLLVGGGAALTPVQGRAARHPLEKLVLRQLPGVLRPFTVLSPQSGNPALQALAERAISEQVTCLIGSVTRLWRLWSFLQKLTHCDSLLDLWPDLTAILYAHNGSEESRESVARMLGSHSKASSVLLLEGVVHPQGALAVEDPRHGRLRVLTDHGTYLELVPLDQIGRPRPERIGLSEARPGEPYAVALTSPAGLWASLIGLTVVLESVHPPLLRSAKIEPSLPAPASILPIRTHGGEELNQPASHRQSADTPVRHPEKLSRNPWSPRADQK